MKSANTFARLLNTEAKIANSDATVLPCDADTVRVVRIALINGHYVFQVVWIEEGWERTHRFPAYRPANGYAIKLKCRLGIDAYIRGLAALKSLRADHVSAAAEDADVELKEAA